MLLPIGTDVQLRNYPSVTYMLIGVNMLFFALSWSVQRAAGDQSTNLAINQIQTFLYECELSSSNFNIWSLFMYQFIHASWWHVIGNMIFLLPFGKVVEDRLGHIGFLALYLGCGAFGGVLHVLLYNVTVIGASGSVCAITAAFAVLAPRSKIKILFVFFLITIFEVPGLLLVIFQVVFDALNLLGSMAGADGGPTAWVVHLGGYVSGIFVIFLLLVTGLIPRGEYDLIRVIQQANRRRQFRAVVSQSRTVKETKEKKLSANQLARASIAQSIVSGQHQVAANQYIKVLNEDPTFTLDSRTRVEVANALLRTQHVSEATVLYEQHLKDKPTPDDVSTVALLLAAKYARVLDNPVRSLELVDTYYDQFTSEHKKLADALRAELAAS
jgi:membrane associated rhomboid family serine protease